MSALASVGLRSSSATAAVVESASDADSQCHCADTTNRRARTKRRREAPAQSCATDALHVIFSFLQLVDVSSCAASCRRWAAAAASGSGIGRHRIDVRLHTLRALATSPLRALVGEINLTSSTVVPADHVESVWATFPHLTALTCRLDWRLLKPDTELRFPTTLRALDISISDRSIPDPWSVLDVLFSLAVRSPLTRLRVATNSADAPPTGAIERLLALQDTLADLELGVKSTSVTCAWRADHLAVFRSLPHLTRLAVSRGSWAAEEIELLTAAPTPHHLRSIDFNRTMEFDAQSLAIARLTSLSSLRLLWLICDPAPLARMTQLETLVIDDCRERSQEVAQAIAQCTTLTDLTLGDVRIRASAAPSWMREFLPALVRLRRLEIPWMPVDIECGAAASHLADTLEELSIKASPPLSSLRHLRSLRRLRSLRLGVELSSGSGETIGLAEEDDETVFLPDLEQLTLRIHGHDADGLDIGRLFGRMPALRRADLAHWNGVTSTHMMKMIKRMPDITSLKLEDKCLQSEELSEVLSSLLCLRDLDLEYADRDLAFLSSPSSGHLGRTLEQLSIISKNEPVSPLDLLHLHSLGALQYLHLNLLLHAGGHTTGVIRQPPADSPRGLASLRELRVRFTGADENMASRASPSEEPPSRPTIDFGRLFGPMPHLRTATIHCDTIISPTTLADALAHSTRLTELTMSHGEVTAAHLDAVVRPLTRLRLLCVGSSSLGSLSFLSAPHLASTMQELNLYPIDQSSLLPPASELHHLRSLAHLRSLTVTLRMRPGDRDDRVARDDYESHRCELWPHAHQYDLTFFEEPDADE